ncbi:MAG: hypothetical protein WDM77_08885 [Steroidobacteraceae bacterium]
MKSILLGALLIVAAPVMAADVGVSVNVAQPGFFGQINLGETPQPPRVVYARPMVIHRDPAFAGRPIYLHVPPGHERHWARHCAEYNACGRPVYFVRDDWYNREYAPRHQHHDHHGEDDRGRDHDHDHDHDHDR